MALEFLGPLIGGIGSLLGFGSNVNTNETNKEINREQMKFNAEQAQLARDWQEDMWNKSNEYNTPVQQMQRLSDAGLNPNLVYGNGADTTAAAVPSTSHASAGSLRGMQDPRLGDLVSQAMQVANMRKQNENLEVQNKVLEEEARGKKITNDIAEATEDEQIQIKKLEKRQQVHKNAILVNQSYQESLNSMKVEKELQKIEIDVEFYQANKEVDLARAKQDMENANKLANKQVELMSSEIAKNYNACLAYEADIALKKFELHYKQKTLPKEIEMLTAKIHEVKENAYRAMESGRTEVYKQSLIGAQKSLTDVLTSKAYQEMDANEQKIILNLWKSTYQLVNGE